MTRVETWRGWMPGAAAAALVLGCDASAPAPWSACARIEAPPIAECSGMVRSRRHAGVFWVHNDSGDLARLFAIDAAGRLRREVRVDGAENVDWEDLTADDAGRLYLGDFGNNRNTRRNLAVYVIAEPEPGTAPAGEPLHVPVLRRLAFRFPEQTAFPDTNRLDFDCEAMYWRAGRLYLLTKHRSDARTVLYRLDPEAPGEQAATRLGDLDVGSPVTAADCSPDGGLVAVLSYQYLDLFASPAAVENVLAGPRHRVLIEGRQCEAVCFDGDRVRFANEQREIFCLGLDEVRRRDRYLPDMPVVAVPEVEPLVDGAPGEWAGGAGCLALRAARLDAAPPGDHACRVRIGWSRRGLLVLARLGAPPASGPDAGAPPRGVVLSVMMGPAGAGEPRLQPGQSVWVVAAAGDSLRARRVEPPSDGPGAPVAVSRAADALTLEVLLPFEPGVAPRAGADLLLNVVVQEPAADGAAELAWSSWLDMQPLANPLLWGRARLEPR